MSEQATLLNQTASTMDDMDKAVLERAMKLLDSIGAKYAVHDRDGGQYGALTAVEERRKIKRTGIDYMALFLPHVEHLQLGDLPVMVGPFDGVNPKFLQSAISAYCCRKWGRDAHMTRVQEDGSVKVVRTG